MKISDDTLSILNNFSSIQGAVVINPGSDISTIAAAKNILVKASVDESFPKQFGIYELSEFLSAISLLEDPSFEFGDDQVEVRSENSTQTIRYNYCDPTCVVIPPNGGNVEFPESDFEFVLTKDDLKAIKKAAGVLNLPHLCIRILDGSNLVASITDKEKGSSSNGFDLKIAYDSEYESEEFDDFYATFSVDNLKVFPGDYLVEVSSKGLGHFVNQDIDLEYWIATESKYSTQSEVADE